MKPFFLAIPLALLPAQASALEPLAGPGNFESVCAQLSDLDKSVRKLSRSKGDGYEDFQSLHSKIMELAFGTLTRATFDADDADPLLGYAETFLLTETPRRDNPSAKAFRGEVKQLKKKYQCF